MSREIAWPCGGHRYEDVGVVCGACHQSQVDKLKAAGAELQTALDVALKLAADAKVNVLDALLIVGAKEAWAKASAAL